MTLDQYIRGFTTEFSILEHYWTDSKLYELYRQMQTNHDNFINEINTQKFDSATATSRVRNLIDAQSSLIRTMDLGSVFVAISDLKKRVFDTTEIFKVLSKDTRITTKQLESVWKVLNDLIKKPSDYNLIKAFLKETSDINNQIVTLKSYLYNAQRIRNVLHVTPPLEENQTRLSITMYAPYRRLADFVSDLDAFCVIYKELSELFAINGEDQNVNIIKVESGSFSLDVFGNKHIIEFVKWYLSTVAKFFHSHFTSEGKIERLSPVMDVIEKQIGILSKINDLNSDMVEGERIDIEESKDHVQKTVVIMSKRVEELVAKQTKIKLDDETIELGIELQEKYIEEATTSLIEHNKNEK